MRASPSQRDTSATYNQAIAIHGGGGGLHGVVWSLNIDKLLLLVYGEPRKLC